MIFLSGICAAFLLLGLLNLPIGFYTFLRLLITIGAVGWIISDLDRGQHKWIVIFVLIAILFNPVIPVYLNDKSVWRIIDLIVAGIFIGKSVSAYMDKPKDSTE